MYLDAQDITPELKQRFEHAQKVIRAAGEKALDYFNRRDELTIETKADPQDVVSIADKDVETIIRGMTRELFPDDGFMGEEHGQETGKNDFLWVIDPIDGTACFLTGMRPWCISVALMKGDRIAAGLVYDPNTDELFAALAGHGAHLNGAPIHSQKSKSVTEGVMGVGISHRVPAAELLPFLDKLLSSGGMFIRNGSCALMMSYVAAGRLIGYFEPHINGWDCLAGIILIKEAGGWCSAFLDNDGLNKGNPILASASGVAADLRVMTGLTS
ncbi:inositol monophosphatase [Kiloniella laminariae]|uniref:Inositol monophosphatase n=1 Tax=Kiloniella laminariae TaxID=454162 RepID=A0ABT4LGJ2_9PROT|nr:inositol monophosphatase [Kiloniella laminariae]MCZ4280217.1 inositol monophosphatase [Kiloniella laminariae]